MLWLVTTHPKRDFLALVNRMASLLHFLLHRSLWLPDSSLNSIYSWELIMQIVIDNVAYSFFGQNPHQNPCTFELLHPSPSIFQLLTETYFLYKNQKTTLQVNLYCSDRYMILYQQRFLLFGLNNAFAEFQIINDTCWTYLCLYLVNVLRKQSVIVMQIEKIMHEASEQVIAYVTLFIYLHVGFCKVFQLSTRLLSKFHEVSKSIGS